MRIPVSRVADLALQLYPARASSGAGPRWRHWKFDEGRARTCKEVQKAGRSGKKRERLEKGGAECGWLMTRGAWAPGAAGGYIYFPPFLAVNPSEPNKHGAFWVF